MIGHHSLQRPHAPVLGCDGAHMPGEPCGLERPQDARLLRVDFGLEEAMQLLDELRTAEQERALLPHLARLRSTLGRAVLEEGTAIMAAPVQQTPAYLAGLDHERSTIVGRADAPAGAGDDVEAFRG